MHPKASILRSSQSPINVSGYGKNSPKLGFQDHGYEIFIPKHLLEGKSALNYQNFAQALEYPFQAFNFFAKAFQ